MENCSNKSQSKDFKVRVNGQVLDITAGMKLDYKTHDRDSGSYGDRKYT
jgi:hypothetical protein